MILSRSHRGRSTDRELTKGADAAPRRAGGGDRRRALERSTMCDEIADRIVAQYGVDRDRAVASADLYMRQLRRSPARSGY